jgi:hypothetical protein
MATRTRPRPPSRIEFTMTLQRRLLHAMLALLGLAALAGVSTIFLPGTDFIFRVAATLSAAAIAIGVAIPASKRLDDQRARSTGLFALAAIVVGFCLALSAVWAEFFLGNLDWELGLTTLAYVATATPAVAFFALRRRPAGWLAGSVGLGFAAATLLCWLVAIWIGTRGMWLIGTKSAMTSGLLALATLPICASLYGGRNDGAWWRWIGVVAGACGLAMGIFGVWLELDGEPTWVQNCFIVATAVGGANVLLRVPLPASQRWLAYATLAALVATAACALFVSLTTDGFTYASVGGLAERLMSAGSIVTVCGILAILLLVAFNKRRLVTESATLAAIRSIDLNCPRCGRKQAAALGESRCDGCGLIFLIRVAEPHCAKCNYALLDLRSKRCPECGEPIDASSAESRPEPARMAT